jgi:hypothetical protein
MSLAAVRLTAGLPAALFLSAVCPGPVPADVASVGVEADAADVERLLKELEGKDIHELIAAGEGQT